MNQDHKATKDLIWFPGTKENQENTPPVFQSFLLSTALTRLTLIKSSVIANELFNKTNQPYILTPEKVKWVNDPTPQPASEVLRAFLQMSLSGMALHTEPLLQARQSVGSIVLQPPGWTHTSILHTTGFICHPWGVWSTEPSLRDLPLHQVLLSAQGNTPQNSTLWPSGNSGIRGFWQLISFLKIKR